MNQRINNKFRKIFLSSLFIVLIIGLFSVITPGLQIANAESDDDNYEELINDGEININNANPVNTNSNNLVNSTKVITTSSPVITKTLTPNTSVTNTQVSKPLTTNTTITKTPVANSVVPITSEAHISSSLKNISLPWYTARGAGIVAFILMFLVIMLGFGMTTGYIYKFISPVKAWLMHKYLSLALGLTLVAHITGLLLDKYINFSWQDVLIPFVSSFKPLYLNLGIFGFYTLLVIIFSSLYFRLKYKKTWRGIHYAVYPLFIFSFIHGIFIGTDSHTVVMTIIYWTTGLIFATIFSYRFILRKK